MAELIRGASVPLFERMVLAGAGAPDQVATPAQLGESIGRELSRLINTRSRLSLREYSRCSGTTLDYGIPDFSALSPQSQPDLEKLQDALLVAIACYEPRLKNVQVRAFNAAAGKNARILISGAVTIDMKLRQLNFELQLDMRQGGLARVG